MADPCGRCRGCGRIADSNDGEPWTDWEELPPGADLAVRAGIVKPLPCPDCRGSGKATAAPTAERSPNTPEPAPQRGAAEPTWELVVRDMRERDAAGAAKYGVRHQHDNGRDHLVDAYQELLDGAVYLRAEIERRRVPGDTLEADLVEVLSKELDAVRQLARDANAILGSTRSGERDPDKLWERIDAAIVKLSAPLVYPAVAVSPAPGKEADHG